MPGVSLPCVLGPGLCLYVTPELEEFSQAKSLLDSHMTFAHTQPAHQEAASNTWLLERMPRHLETELFSLDDRRGVITLGRKKGSDKVCSGQKVSRHHISLIRSQRGWGVIDVGSTCGTFVNGLSLERNKVRVLSPGDLISLGSSNTEEAGSIHYRVVPPSLEDDSDQGGDTDDEGFDDTPAPSPNIEHESVVIGHESEREEDQLQEIDENLEITDDQIKVELKEDSRHISIIKECYVSLSNIQESEQENFVCELCDFSGSNIDSLNIHIKDEHIKISYPCDECPHTAASQQELKQHIMSIHENIVEEFEKSKQVDSNCKNLEKEIEEPAAKIKIKKDMEVHRVKRYFCDQCPHIARNATRLAMHKQTAHSDVQIKCQNCDYICKHEIHLKHHMRRMHEEKRFVCEECGCKFYIQGQLNRHIRETHNDTDFVCDQCNWTGKNKETFKRHLEKHLGIKYECKKCDHEAVSSKALRAHINIVHENVKYQCHVCDYNAKSRSNLLKHLERPDHGGRLLQLRNLVAWIAKLSIH